MNPKHLRLRRSAIAITTAVAALAATFSAGLAAEPAGEPKARRARQPVVQLALLLDTSNSMDGLIDQARTRLWQVVNDLALAKQGGLRPRLEVALFEYGNSGLPSEGGFIREVSPFTEDLDEISARLFALRTNGGDEYCGAVIERSLQRLAWSEHKNDLKLIFIAGNEPFTQGPVDFRTAVRAAIHRSIAVNTIFCGPESEGIATGWKDGAVLADGTFATIDQNQRLPNIDAPQDKQLAALNENLNATYIAYGSQGRARQEMQRAQDANAAAAAPSVAAQRATAKSSAFYKNSSWDIVDAVKEGEVDLAGMDEDSLPEELKNLSPEERKAKVAALNAERERIQAEIRALSTEREAYVTAERAKMAGADSSALDDAIRNSVRAQAEKKAYTFETKSN
jgi:hypothetical protein